MIVTNLYTHILMKEIRFANIITIWKWWIQAHLHVAFFPKNFSLNIHHLSDSIYIWNCCNQALKNFNWNSMHSYNRKIWVDISFYIIFPWLYYGFYKNPPLNNSRYSTANIERLSYTICKYYVIFVFLFVCIQAQQHSDFTSSSIIWIFFY